ncbi:MAG TPA: adenylate/guanylate cyclase domain-containing protein [Actinomycetota bacterium]|nr:adenylate/guanylate cyclase domain-containing protein [Actinomycetota bacterium]
MPATRPPTKYAKSGDVHIAYQVIGDGPIDLVWVPGWFSNVETNWDFPQVAYFFDRLASFSRLILFDKRGTGLSDPVTVATPPTIEERMDDVRAVMDAVGSERAALLGLSEGGPMSMVFAATYPERTAALLLTGTFATAVRHDDYPIGVHKETAEEVINAVVDGWGEGLIVQFAVPSGDSPQLRRRVGEYERSSASPGMVRALMYLNLDIDVRPLLRTIQVPTLVLHREGDRFVWIDHGRYLAEHIPGAKLIELPGIDHVPWFGDTDRFVDEVQEFLTGARHSIDPDRVLATVMFTDIVGSTQQAAAMGDRRWREVLGRYHDLARRQIERFGGREVKTMGDGTLATFDGPARAVRAATGISNSVRSIGIEIRSGLHTGECEMVGDDVGGIAVHIGARVAGLAEPGEVLVSRTVKDLVVGSGLTFLDRGEHELRGVPGTWQLFAVEH